MVLVSFKKAGTHEENRYKLCLICLKKSKVIIEVKGAIKEKIVALCSEYDPNDERLPAALCTVCKIKVYRLFKEKKKSIKLKLSDYSKFVPLRKNTRETINLKCQCSLCK